MKKNRLWNIILCTLLPLTSMAQTQLKPVEYRFINGEKGLKEFLIQNVSYPKISQSYRAIGFSISGISITPEGKIENIKIVNPIDEYIDAEVIRLLKSTSKLWLKCDTVSNNQAFYIQIAFVLSGPTPNFFVLNPTTNKMFIEPVTVTAMYPKNENSFILETDESLAIKCSVLIYSKRYDEALGFIDELIRRNPFMKELYQYRISVCKKLGRQDLIEIDVQKLQNFADGLSLAELLNKY